MTGQPLVSAEFSAGYGDTTVLHQVSFEIQPGEILGLAGSSGSGKSTLVLSLLGLIQAKRGWVKGKLQFGGRNLLSLRPKQLRRVLGAEISYVPPDPRSALNPQLPIENHFREAWRAHNTKPWKTVGAPTVAEKLMGVELPATAEFLGRYPGQISSGQAQRVLIALALLHNPRLILADEPTSAVDTVTQASLFDLLRRINKEHATSILFVTHDLMGAISLCDRLAILSGGKIVETVTTASLAKDAKHPATLALLNALPQIPDGALPERPNRLS